MSKHGKRYQKVAKLIEPKKLYPLAEALALVKQASTIKFDASVEVHIKLGINAAKSDQQVRGTVALPFGLGRSRVIAVVSSNLDKLNEAKAAGAKIVGGAEIIQQIKEGKISFEVLVATPEMMKDLATVAKILGPRGLMPNPKNETVTQNIKQVVEELSKGRADFKNDDTGNVHQIIGKTSFAPENLLANFNTFVEAVKKVKPAASKGVYLKNISICSTMGPGIRVQI
ncbi:MAG: 50S ribosomal protein L1 [Candidatus Buchananbacteria bacterium]